jgi:hypothetical protein
MKKYIRYGHKGPAVKGVIVISSQKKIAAVPEMMQKRNILLQQAKKAERIGDLTRSASLLEELVSTMEDGETAALLSTPIKSNRGGNGKMQQQKVSF